MRIHCSRKKKTFICMCCNVLVKLVNGLCTLPQEDRFIPYKPASVHFLEQARFYLSKALIAYSSNYSKVLTANFRINR